MRWVVSFDSWGGGGGGGREDVVLTEVIMGERFWNYGFHLQQYSSQNCNPKQRLGLTVLALEWIQDVLFKGLESTRCLLSRP